MAIEKDLGAVSAYAIAIENGFQGTEEEWLDSLRYDHSDEFGILAEQVQRNAESAADSEQAAELSKQSAAQSADAAKQSAEQSAQIAEGAGQIVKDAETAAVAVVNKAEATAVSRVSSAGQSQIDAVNTAGASALSAIETTKNDAVGAVNTAGTQAVDAVNTAGTQAAENAETAITDSKNQAVTDVQNAGQSAVGAVEEAQTAGVQAVEAAQTNAVQAVQDAGGAEAERLSDIVPLVTEADEGKILTVLDGKWAAVNPAITNWGKVQLIVRAGLAPQYFPAGYEFITRDGMEDTDIVWRVVGHDTIKAADETLTHTMILEAKYVYSKSTGSYISLQFDAQEALYYAKEELLAGTYNFTLFENYDTTYGGGKTYSFTLAKPVPAGGVIMFPWGYNQQASEVKISTYATQAGIMAIETVPVTEGSEGTSLGTADGKTENMNHTHRIRYGSNNYAQSAIKQWLNSAEAVGSVWTPQTVFDRPPNWASNRTGFLAGLPEDFLSVVQAAIVPCRTNSIFEVDSLDGTEFAINQIYNLQDRFFLLSRPEIYGTWDSAEVKDGELLEYYSGLTDAERIKYDPSGSARYCWLRSPSPGIANFARSVNTSGALSNDTATSALAAAPACIIA